MTERWVIHLPVTAPDLHRARVFARTAARVLAQLSARVEPGGARYRRITSRRAPVARPGSDGADPPTPSSS